MELTLSTLGGPPASSPYTGYTTRRKEEERKKKRKRERERGTHVERPPLRHSAYIERTQM